VNAAEGLRRTLAPLFKGRPLDKSKLHKVAVIKLCCLGDVALSTPLVRALKLGLPGAELVYVTGAYSSPAGRRVAYADRVIVVPDGGLPRLRSLWALRSEGFDLAVLLHKSAGAVLGSCLTGSAARLGFDWRGQGFAFTHSLPFDPSAHEVSRYLSLLGPLGLSPQGEDTSMALLPGDAEAGDALLRANGLDPLQRLAVVFPGGGKNPGTLLAAKRWGPEGFRALAGRLQGAGWQVAVLHGPGPEDTAAAASVAQGLGPRVAAVGGQGWAADFGVLSRAAWYCGGDTGTTHFAAALGVPTLTLFGPTDPGQWAPLGPRHRQVWRALPCSPCFTATERLSARFHACRDWACLAALPTEEVLAAAAGHLQALGLGNL
jgi:heptosyltransferase-2